MGAVGVGLGTRKHIGYHPLLERRCCLAVSQQSTVNKNVLFGLPFVTNRNDLKKSYGRMNTYQNTHYEEPPGKGNKDMCLTSSSD